MWVPHIYWTTYDVISSSAGKRSRGRIKALRCTLPSFPPLPIRSFIHFVHLNLRESGGLHGVLFFSDDTFNHPSLITPLSHFSLTHLLCFCRRCLSRWRFRSQVRKLQQSLRIGIFCYCNCHISYLLFFRFDCFTSHWIYSIFVFLYFGSIQFWDRWSCCEDLPIISQRI